MDAGEKTPEARERIIKAATELFARKGYAGTGMRELAAAADVHLTMVNYYFGSKRGLLDALMQRYFAGHVEIILRAFDSDGPIEERVRAGIRELTGWMRRDPGLVRIAFTELPYDIPNAAELRAQYVRAMVEPALRTVLPEISSRAERPVTPQVVGPALLGILVFHFLMRPVVEHVFERSFDDAFYDSFPEQVANIFLYGVLGTPPGGGDPEVP